MVASASPTPAKLISKVVGTKKVISKKHEDVVSSNSLQQLNLTLKLKFNKFTHVTEQIACNPTSLVFLILNEAQDQDVAVWKQTKIVQTRNVVHSLKK